MTNAFHHVAVRVSDIDRTTAFYERVFGGRIVMEVELPPDFVMSVFGGRAGVKARNRFFECDGGWSLEAFHLDPSNPLSPTDQTRVGLMHFCVYVDDVRSTVDLAEQYGGTALFPVRHWHDRQFVYITDPDGNVIELIDAKVSELRVLARLGLPDEGAQRRASHARARPLRATQDTS